MNSLQKKFSQITIPQMPLSYKSNSEASEEWSCRANKHEMKKGGVRCLHL